jgi:nucleoside-diphosphate-sugar epimerase
MSAASASGTPQAGRSDAAAARQTVAVTGASGFVGQALLGALPADVRRVALVRPGGHAEADCVVAAALESPAAMEAMAEADVLIHLVGGLVPRRGIGYRGTNLLPAQRVAEAVRRGRTRRIVFLSYVGADRGSHNEYLASKALAEDVLRGSGRELVVFRSTHVIGSPAVPGPTASALLCREGRPVRVLGTGGQRVAPIHVGDVVAALLAAVRGGPAGTYELAGPQVLSMDDLVRLVNRSWFTPIRHVPGTLAWVLAEVAPGLSAPLVDVMLRDSLGDPGPARDAFGLTLTRLDTVWR